MSFYLLKKFLYDIDSVIYILYREYNLIHDYYEPRIEVENIFGDVPNVIANSNIL